MSNIDGMIGASKPEYLVNFGPEWVNSESSFDFKFVCEQGDGFRFVAMVWPSCLF